MERILYLNRDFCAVAEDGRLVEYIPVLREDETGRILYGRVNRIMAGLEAAFVDIGRNRDGFLPLKENSASFTGAPLRSGDRVLIQIRKEETGRKGAYLSRDLSLPGSALILMPMNRHIGVSARITDPGERERLTDNGAVGKLHRRVKTALTVYQHLNIIGREPKKMYRFNNLKALIHKSGGVNGDFSPH